MHAPSQSLRTLLASNMFSIRNASDVLLRFTIQKNRHHNKRIGQKTTSHPFASPRMAVADQIIHLHANNAPLNTLLCTFTKRGQWFVVTANMLTVLLC